MVMLLTHWRAERPEPEARQHVVYRDENSGQDKTRQQTVQSLSSLHVQVSDKTPQTRQNNKTTTRQKERGTKTPPSLSLQPMTSAPEAAPKKLWGGRFRGKTDPR